MEQTARGPDSIASDTEYDEDLRELEENYEASSEEEKELDYERGYTNIDKDNDYENSSADSMDEDEEEEARAPLLSEEVVDHMRSPDFGGLL